VCVCPCSKATFFAPTDDAIDGFSEWAGYTDIVAGLKELFGGGGRLCGCFTPHNMFAVRHQLHLDPAMLIC